MLLQGQIHFGWHSTKKIEMYLYSRQICLINKLFCLISFRLCAHFRSFDNSNTCSTFRSIIDISNESSFMLSTENHYVFTKWSLFTEAIFLKICIKSITPIGMYRIPKSIYNYHMQGIPYQTMFFLSMY